MTFGFCTPFGTNDTAWQQCSFDVFGLIHSQLRVVTRLSATASRRFALRRSISLSLCVWVRTSHTRDVSDQRSQQRLQAIWSVEHSGNRKKKLGTPVGRSIPHATLPLEKFPIVNRISSNTRIGHIGSIGHRVHGGHFILGSLQGPLWELYMIVRDLLITVAGPTTRLYSLSGTI